MVIVREPLVSILASLLYMSPIETSFDFPLSCWVMHGLLHASEFSVGSWKNVNSETTERM